MATQMKFPFPEMEIFELESIKIFIEKSSRAQFAKIGELEKESKAHEGVISDILDLVGSLEIKCGSHARIRQETHSEARYAAQTSAH